MITQFLIESGRFNKNWNLPFKEMDQSERKGRRMSTVISEDRLDGLTDPPALSAASNSASHEDVRKIIDTQKDIMDSNMRVQIKARKVSLVAAIFIVVFILGLMIGIVVYKDRRMKRIESRNELSISKMREDLNMNNKTINDLRTALSNLEQKQLNKENNMNEVINKFNATLKDLHVQVETNKKEIELKRTSTSTSTTSRQP